MSSKNELALLHEHWARINTCTLKDIATRPVYGNGNPNAEIVFIGEAPGKKEDETGVPFIGASGTFLSEMLDSIGMNRNDIYITNIVKYRPPDNRDPSLEEKEACRGWLNAEITAINPNLIVFLGRHSMNDFFPEEKISVVHGKLLIKKFYSMTTTHFLPLYHPAAALYNGSLRQNIIDDFKKIPVILDNIKKPPHSTVAV